MSRKKILAGNWKMYKSINEARNWIRVFQGSKKGVLHVDILLFPAYTTIYPIGKEASKANISLGAQNLHEAEEGAYTGEVSGKMLVEAGADWVLIGHSERRTLFGEHDQRINLKVLRALISGLKPILCVGETLEEREANQQEDVVRRQLIEGLKDIHPDDLYQVVIAYEPVWAIGTGQTATPQDAQEMHSFIRSVIGSQWKSRIAESIRILYGGSVKPDNAKELFACPDIDGGLVGGASLKAETFLSILRAF